MELFLIRHGTTPGNQLGLYVGKLDQPLSEEGIQKAQECAQDDTYPPMERIYVSPMLRARQTAEILFPQAEQIVVPNLREMDFGDFEGRAYEDLKDDPAYVQWADTECAASCPNGESGTDFETRVHAAFSDLIDNALEQDAPQVVLVSHGGVGMNIMARWAHPKLAMYHWWLPNCGGYRIEINRADWERGRFTSWTSIGRESWRNHAYTFFQNTDCEYFPCHEVEYPEDFNCLFCYCPLYYLGMKCGGTPQLSANNHKDCTHCTLNHTRDSFGVITERLRRKN